MSLIQIVVGMVCERGRATVDELLPELPEFSRQQVLDAMKNARNRGLIHCEKAAPKKGEGNGSGMEPSMHYPGPSPKKQAGTKRPTRVIATRPPNSAWELAHGLQIAGAWPPAWPDGRRYELLGGWEAA